MQRAYFNSRAVSAAIWAAVGGPPLSGSGCLQALFAEENCGEWESDPGLKLRPRFDRVGSGNCGTP
jgi:hypothetical protein